MGGAHAHNFSIAEIGQDVQAESITCSRFRLRGGGPGNTDGVDRSMEGAGMRRNQFMILACIFAFASARTASLYASRAKMSDPARDSLHKWRKYLSDVKNQMDHGGLNDPWRDSSAIDAGFALSGWL